MMYTLVTGIRRRTCLSSEGRALCREHLSFWEWMTSYMEKHLMDLAVDRKLVTERRRTE